MSEKCREVTAVVIVNDRPAPDYNYICKNIVVITREHDVFYLPSPTGSFYTQLAMRDAIKKVLYHNHIKLSVYDNRKTNLYFIDIESLNFYMVGWLKNGT